MLVEREADEQRHRISRDERVGLVRIREVQAIGHILILLWCCGVQAGVGVAR